MTVKISVVMACYNSARYLAIAIDSILAQTISAWELIIVDDCSTDHTSAIAKKYCVQDSRISFIALEQNQGPAAARNAALAVAKGEWIAILDSDDVALPHRLEEQLHYAEKNQEYVLIGSNADIINNNDELIQNYQYPTSHEKLSKALFSHGAFPPHSSILYRASAIKSLGGFNQHFLRSQDFDLFLRLSELGKLVSIDKTLAKIREHDANISHTNGGLLQYKFAIAALVCHVLRTEHHQDPSHTHCAAFLEFIDKNLHELNDYHFYQTRERLKKEYQSAASRLTKLWVISKNLFAVQFVFQLIKRKFFKSGISDCLAHKWLRQCERSI